MAVVHVEHVYVVEGWFRFAEIFGFYLFADLGCCQFRQWVEIAEGCGSGGHFYFFYFILYLVGCWY